MRLDWRTAGLVLTLTQVVAGCGSYSAPNNTPTAPDSAGDTTAMSPPPTGYSQQ